jgi:hypothetical protein
VIYRIVGGPMEGSFIEHREVRPPFFQITVTVERDRDEFCQIETYTLNEQGIATLKVAHKHEPGPEEDMMRITSWEGFEAPTISYFKDIR